MRGPIKGARLAGIPLVRQRFKRECADLLTKGSYCFEIRTDATLVILVRAPRLVHIESRMNFKQAKDESTSTRYFKSAA